MGLVPMSNGVDVEITRYRIGIHDDQLVVDFRHLRRQQGGGEMKAVLGPTLLSAAVPHRPARRRCRIQSPA